MEPCDKSDGLTRRQAIRSSLAGLAAGGAMTVPLVGARAQPFGAEQRAVAERILRREVDSGNVPGIAWSIGTAKEILAEGAVGLKIVSPATPMGAATRCALASVSKQFTATCVFMLRDLALLSLDAPLAEYVPSYKDASKMTLRQILGMSSGISTDTEACEAAVAGRIDDGALIENLNRVELEFPPGAHFAYSNCAFDIAGAVVAKLSGMPFARFAEERIFKPLGMTSTYQLGARGDADFAEGYAPDGKGWKPATLTTADKTFASGNLVSNTADMQRWNRAILNATLLPRKSQDEMFVVVPLSSGVRTNYASGWFVDLNGIVWHGGTLEGYGNSNMLVPATGHAIVMLGNTAPGMRWKPWEVAREIYNEAKLGPALPQFMPIIGTTLPKKG
jgi:D-alanyl-D-alanine carboxypeptidase